MHLCITHRAVFVGFQVAYNAGFADLGYGMEREESQVLVRADTPSPFHFVPIAKVCPKAQQNRDVCFAHLAPASYTSPGAGGSCVSVFRDSWWNLMKVQNEPQDSKPPECKSAKGEPAHKAAPQSPSANKGTYTFRGWDSSHRHPELLGHNLVTPSWQPPPFSPQPCRRRESPAHSQECRHSTMVVASIKYPPQRAHMR